MNDGSAYFATIAATSFSLIIFGAALVGSRLIALAERAATLDRERGDFMNQKVSSESSLQASWAERGRRNELADLHVLTKRVRRAIAAPVLVALVTGVASLVLFLGWPDDSTRYRVAVLVGVVGASVLWMWMLLRYAGDVLVFTRGAHEQRAKERKELTESGKPYLISGDPGALTGAFERLELLIGVPSWRHPLKRLTRSRWKRRATRGGERGV